MFLPLQTFASIVLKLSIYKKYLVLLNGFLLHLTYGSVYTFGNLATYITSYQRMTNPNVTIHETMWIQAISFGTTGVALPLGGFLEKIWGPRNTTLIAAILMSSGVFLTSLTIQYSSKLVWLTYGFMYGVGARLGYISPIAAAMRLFPEKQQGFATGVIVSGYGLGAFIFNFVQRAYINPLNLPAEQNGYFEDEEMLNRVPGIFYVLGCCYLGIQLFALSFMGCYNNTELAEPEAGGLLKKDHRVLNSDRVRGQTSTSIRLLIQSPLFFALWFTFLFNEQVIIAVTGLYKSFGLNFHWMDDSFLTLIGALAALSNAGSRMLWGVIADRLDYKTLMITLTGLVTSLMLSFYATPFAGAWVYAIWVILINGITPGNYILLQKACGRYFGINNLSFNYSLLFTNYLIGGPLSMLVSKTLFNSFGWVAVFWSTALFSAASAVITLFLPNDDEFSN